MKLFGIEIDERSRVEVLKDLTGRIDSSRKVFVVTANALIMTRVWEDSSYREAVKKADLVIPDGTGIALAARLKGKRIHKYPGVELAQDLLRIGRERGWKFYLLGARFEVVRRLAAKLEDEGISVVGFHHGYFDGEGPAKEIASLKPDVVFVAMGVPKQELWIVRNLEKFEKGLFIGVGGTFDVLAGFKRRAPRWMVKMGLEWLYRILQEPHRRWKVALKLLKFLILVLSDRGDGR